MVEDKAGNSKGKALVVWNESENEIEIQKSRDSRRMRDHRQRAKILHKTRYAKRNKDLSLLYGRGIACVSGVQIRDQENRVSVGICLLICKEV